MYIGLIYEKLYRDIFSEDKTFTKTMEVIMVFRGPPLDETLRETATVTMEEVEV